MTFPDMFCRKCDIKNPMTYFAPVYVSGSDARTGLSCDGRGVATCICVPCAIRAGFATADGDLKEGVTL